MKKRRIFIAINLSSEIKQELSVFQEEWKDLPSKWVDPENLHITLAFLAYLKEPQIKKVGESIKKIAPSHNPFSIHFSEIDYGPKDKGIPRLIWVKGEKTEELQSLKKNLDTTLQKSIGFKPRKRPFRPHITLARIKKWEWKRIEPEDRPQIPVPVSLNHKVNSIEVMESKLKRGGPEYQVLESISLK